MPCIYVYKYSDTCICLYFVRTCIHAHARAQTHTFLHTSPPYLSVSLSLFVCLSLRCPVFVFSLSRSLSLSLWLFLSLTLSLTLSLVHSRVHWVSLFCSLPHVHTHMCEHMLVCVRVCMCICAFLCVCVCVCVFARVQAGGLRVLNHLVWCSLALHQRYSQQNEDSMCLAVSEHSRGNLQRKAGNSLQTYLCSIKNTFPVYIEQLHIHVHSSYGLCNVFCYCLKQSEPTIFEDRRLHCSRAKWKRASARIGIQFAIRSTQTQLRSWNPLCKPLLILCNNISNCCERL